ALRTRRIGLVDRLVNWGAAIEGEEEAPFERVLVFLRSLEASNELDAYFEAAAACCTPDRIRLTGYLAHDLLCHRFPCCDVAIFPSVVKEAAPLVVPEAMASGCFPIGTYYAGMAASLDAAAEAVPPAVARFMRLRHDPRFTVRDIIEHVSEALVVAGSY